MIDKEAIQEQVQRKLLEIIVNDPEMILAVKQVYLTEDLWKVAIENEPKLFKKVKHPSVSLCYYAVAIDGSNLKHVVKKVRYVKITPKLAVLAINSCPKALFDIPKEVVDDGLKELAFDKDEKLLAEYTGSVRPEYVQKKVHENPSIIQWIKNPSEEMLIEALNADPCSIVYIKEPSQKIIELMKTKYPQYWDMVSDSIMNKLEEKRM